MRAENQPGVRIRIVPVLPAEGEGVGPARRLPLAEGIVGEGGEDVVGVRAQPLLDVSLEVERVEHATR